MLVSLEVTLIKVNTTALLARMQGIVYILTSTSRIKLINRPSEALVELLLQTKLLSVLRRYLVVFNAKVQTTKSNLPTVVDENKCCGFRSQD